MSTRRLTKTRCAEIMAGHVVAYVRKRGAPLDLATVLMVLVNAQSGQMGGWVATVARNANERTTLREARRLQEQYVDPATLPVQIALSIPGNLATETNLASLRTLLDATKWSWLAEEITEQVKR